MLAKPPQFYSAIQAQKGHQGGTAWCGQEARSGARSLLLRSYATLGNLLNRFVNSTSLFSSLKCEHGASTYPLVFPQGLSKSAMLKLLE